MRNGYIIAYILPPPNVSVKYFSQSGLSSTLADASESPWASREEAEFGLTAISRTIDVSYLSVRPSITSAE